MGSGPGSWRHGGAEVFQGGRLVICGLAQEILAVSRRHRNSRSFKVRGTPSPETSVSRQSSLAVYGVRLHTPAAWLWGLVAHCRPRFLLCKMGTA